MNCNRSTGKMTNTRAFLAYLVAKTADLEGRDTYTFSTGLFDLLLNLMPWTLQVELRLWVR